MRLIFTVLIALIPSLSLATPPRVVDIDEKLFALDDTHVFILRTLTDNFGFYQVSLSDVTLIARNRETGRDDQHWPVLSIRDNGPIYSEDETQSRVQNLGLPERVNPYDIMLWRKAWVPLGSGHVYQPDAYTISTDTITFADYDKTYTASLALAQDMLHDSLRAARETIPFNPGSGPSTQTIEMSREDPLLLWPQSFGDACRVIEQYILDREIDNAARQYAVKVDCRDNEEPFAVFVILNTLP